jgi:hypothetical protein|tara:strand:- start:240 stop:581 length:342 start_codon:yes stop_codon:yes gene_type:complete
VANINGWGRGAWNDGSWGEPLSVVVSGVNGTGSITSVAGVSADANLTTSGVHSTLNINGVSVGIGFTVNVSGVTATGDIGSVSIWSNIIPSQPSQDWQAVSTSQTPNWTGIAA